MPHYNGSQVLSVTGTSAAFATGLTAGKEYVLAATTDIWWIITATSGGDSAAIATANNHYLKAGDARVIRTPYASQSLRCIVHTGASNGTAILSTIDQP